jgi:hypothetical protein
MKTSLFATIALLAGITHSAHAASSLVDVQFTGYSNKVQTGAAVVGSYGDAWNTLTYGSNNGAVDALSFTDGLASSVGITYSAQNFWTSSASYDQFTGTAAANLMSTYLVGYENPVSIALTGLTAGQQYGFWVYTQGDDNSAGRSIGFTANGVAVATATQTNIATFAEGNNYVYFTTFADANGHIDLDATTLAGEANINGFQMTAVPESSSLAFMVAGLFGFGALALRRRATLR